jgi:L-ribulose-5-phosphate 3-epimerase UlaE
MSIDETDEHIARLYWDKQEIKEIVSATADDKRQIRTMCLSGNRR